MKLIFILFFLISTLLAQTKNVTLSLPWKHQFQFAGYYVAQQKGYYQQAGLKVDIKEYDFNEDYIENVASGKFEFGVAHSSVIFKRYNKYSNIILLNAIHQSSPFALLSLKYKNLEDVVGKNIMMSSDETVGVSINAMLQSKKIPQKSYKLIKNTFKSMDLLSYADFMPVYISNEPYILRQKNIEYFIFYPKDYGYDFYSDILFTTKEMIENNKKDVDSFRQASLMGWKYAYENIDETVDIILKYYNTQGKSKEALLHEAKTLKDLAFMDGRDFGDINPSRVQEITTTYRLLGLINQENIVQEDNFIYTTQNDLKFILKEKATTSYFSFIYTIYFKFMLILLISILVIGIIMRIRTEKMLRAQATQLKLNNEIFNKNICSSTADINGVIISVSDALCKCTGYKRDELISKKHSIFKHKDTPEEIYKDLWMSISSGHIWQGQLKNRKKDGSEYYVDMIIYPKFDKKDVITSYETIVHDISLEKLLENFNEKLELQVKEKTRELEKLAMTDKLTGIFNRVKLDNDLETNFNYFKNFGENFSIIIIDIDNFKNVNDTHGHQVGDIILQELTHQIQKNIRSTDVLGRWGGEEFLVICSKSDMNTSYDLAEKLRKNIEEYSFSRVKKLTICAGVCDIKYANNLEKMVSYADTALYDAKHSGRNNVLKYGDIK